VSITGTMAEAPAAALTAPGAPGAALPADDWAERRLRKALYRGLIEADQTRHSLPVRPVRAKPWLAPLGLSSKDLWGAPQR